MALEWNVQPYQRLSEMRDAYTQVLLAGTTSMIEQLAPEIEQWMKDNKTWTDRSYRARDSLEARVESDVSGAQAYKSGLAEANRRDNALLQELNRGRRQGIVYETETYVSPRTGEKITSIAKNQATRTPGQSALVPLKRVPKAQSHVAMFKASFKTEKLLIGNIHLSYGDRPPHYALWLEVANQGRYSIITRARDHWGETLRKRLQRVANLVQFQKYNITFGEEVSPEAQFREFIAKNFGGQLAEPYYPHDPARRKMNVARRRRERSIRWQKEELGTFKRKTRSDKGIKKKRY